MDRPPSSDQTKESFSSKPIHKTSPPEEKNTRHSGPCGISRITWAGQIPNWAAKVLPPSGAMSSFLFPHLSVILPNSIA